MGESPEILGHEAQWNRLTSFSPVTSLDNPAAFAQTDGGRHGRSSTERANFEDIALRVFGDGGATIAGFSCRKRWTSLYLDCLWSKSQAF